MCGVAALVGPWAHDDERLAAMVRVQHHRGPDDRGRWSDEGAGVALGHNRLSILDLTPRGRQPMLAPEGDLALVFNGEVYNYRELRSELDGWDFRSGTDTEVVLAAYRAWGEACVERFVGMFAFAMWDAKREVLFCARDRLGIKPLHWARGGGSVALASEVKALLAAGVPCRPDADTWATYLAHGVYDHSDATFFEGVRALAPGHVMTVRPRPGAEPEVTMRAYWDLPALTRDVEELSDADAEARLLERLDDAVRLRLRSDVPLGVNLSGGLDSASLMASVDRAAPGSGALETFTAAFDDARYDESEFAAAVPHRHPWTRHVERLRPGDVWALATAMTWHQEAPFGGVATVAYHRLHQRARDEGVTVLLEGQGVDECLAGYRYVAPHHHRDLLEAGRREELRRELRADGRAAGDGWRGALGRLRALLGGGRGPLYQDGTAHLRPSAVAPEVRARAGAEPAFERPYPDHLRNALWKDLRHTKLPRVLRMNDRLSMASSRELREPWLDHRVVELLFRMPGHQKLRDGRTKAVLRRAAQDRLPDAVRLAAKRAVVTPQREWLRGPLAGGVEALLASGRFWERGLFDPDEVEGAWRAFREGEGGNAFFVWQWIGAELWHRRFVDGDEGVPEELAGAAAASADREG